MQCPSFAINSNLGVCFSSVFLLKESLRILSMTVGKKHVRASGLGSEMQDLCSLALNLVLAKIWLWITQ